VNEESLKIAQIDPRDYFGYEACRRCGFPPCRRLLFGGQTVYGRDFLIIHRRHYNTVRPCPFATGSFDEAETFFNRLSIQDINSRVGRLLNDLHVVERLRYPTDRCLTNWADIAEKIGFLRMLWRDRVYALVRVPFQPEEKIKRWMTAHYDCFSAGKTVKEEKKESSGGEEAVAITSIIKKTSEPTTNYKLPLLIAKSAKRPRYKLGSASELADDMKARDYSISDYKKIDRMCEDDDLIIGVSEGLLHASDASLFSTMGSMSTKLFSMGDLEDNIKRMIAHFRGNTSADYSNEILNREVKKHPSMLRFVDIVNKTFKKKIVDLNLSDNIENIGLLEINERPHFNRTADKFFGGLTIAVNDTTAYDVMLLEYKKNSNGNYNAKIKITLYDHFGLDQPDLEKIYVHLGGFRAWFILQHIRGYKSFVTVIENTFEISGTL
jgi:hypothetical protein